MYSNNTEAVTAAAAADSNGSSGTMASSSNAHTASSLASAEQLLQQLISTTTTTPPLASSQLHQQQQHLLFSALFAQQQHQYLAAAADAGGGSLLLNYPHGDPVATSAINNANLEWLSKTLASLGAYPQPPPSSSSVSAPSQHSLSPMPMGTLFQQQQQPSPSLPSTSPMLTTTTATARGYVREEGSEGIVVGQPSSNSVSSPAGGTLPATTSLQETNQSEKRLATITTLISQAMCTAQTLSQQNYSFASSSTAPSTDILIAAALQAQLAAAAAHKQFSDEVNIGISNSYSTMPASSISQQQQMANYRPHSTQQQHISDHVDVVSTNSDGVDTSESRGNVPICDVALAKLFEGWVRGEVPLDLSRPLPQFHHQHNHYQHQQQQQPYPPTNLTPQPRTMSVIQAGGCTSHNGAGGPSHGGGGVVGVKRSASSACAHHLQPGQRDTRLMQPYSGGSSSNGGSGGNVVVFGRGGAGEPDVAEHFRRSLRQYRSNMVYPTYRGAGQHSGGGRGSPATPSSRPPSTPTTKKKGTLMVAAMKSSVVNSSNGGGGGSCCQESYVNDSGESVTDHFRRVLGDNYEEKWFSVKPSSAAAATAAERSKTPRQGDELNNTGGGGGQNANTHKCTYEEGTPSRSSSEAAGKGKDEEMPQSDADGRKIEIN